MWDEKKPWSDARDMKLPLICRKLVASAKSNIKFSIIIQKYLSTLYSMQMLVIIVYGKVVILTYKFH